MAKSNPYKFKANVDINNFENNDDIYSSVYSTLKEKNKNVSDKYLESGKFPLTRAIVPFKSEETFRTLKDYDSIETTYSHMQKLIDDYFESSDVEEFCSVRMYRHFIRKYHIFFNEFVIKMRNDSDSKFALNTGMLFKVKCLEESLIIEYYTYLTGTPIKFILAFCIDSNFQATLLNKGTIDDFKEELELSFNSFEKAAFYRNPNKIINAKKDKLIHDSEALLYQIIIFLCYISNKLENHYDTEIHGEIDKAVTTPPESKNKSSSPKDPKDKGSNNMHVYTLDDLIKITVYKKNKHKGLARNRWKNREHSVRGFPRHYKSGKVVWIKPHKRGSNNFGEEIHKNIVVL